MPEHPFFASAQSLIQGGQSQVLQLSFGTRSVKPGDRISKAEAQSTPEIGWTTSPGQKYIILCLDLDAPFPSFPFLSPILHWFQAGLETNVASGTLTAASEPPICPWGPPGPPPISAPHRYVFALYDQPADFDPSLFTKAAGYAIRDRMRWDFAKFEKQMKLGRAVAATYFLSK